MKTLLIFFIGFFTSLNAFDNISLIQNNQDEIIVLKQKIDTLNERVDGLTTLLEGLTMDIEQLKHSKKSQNSNDNNMRLDVLEAKVNLLSKGQLEELEDKRDSNKTLKPPKEKRKIEPKPSKLYTQGVRLFMKHKYSEAKKNFEMTDKKNYKRASSNYYLGEIAYYTKKYNEAIRYFKKSVKIYDKASYNDRMLLHTAISLEKINDNRQAKIFYQMIIESYPDKPSAIVAKENLTQL